MSINIEELRRMATDAGDSEKGIEVKTDIRGTARAG